MDKINVEYGFIDVDGETHLSVKVMGNSLTNLNAFSLLGEIGESLIKTTHSNLLIDLSQLEILNSSCLGTVMNLKEVAELNKKNLKIKFSKVVAEVMGLHGSRIGNILVA